jgi:hypothetical protein
MSQLQAKFSKKLKGSHFRWLNEQLYTSPSTTAFSLFQDDPSLFDSYHAGYRSQVQSWPENPLDHMISFCRAQVASRPPPAAGTTPLKIEIGDFGCGEARLAQTLSALPATAGRVRCHSFDLVAANQHITACDIAKTPLANASLDIAIFCLSLMGTNYMNFLREAHRTLKANGALKIAEVQSRIADHARFIAAVTDIGFTCLNSVRHVYLIESIYSRCFIFDSVVYLSLDV